MTTEPWAIALVLFATSLGSFGPLFLKRASGTFSFKPGKIIENKNLLIGLMFYAISTIIFIPALKGGELSVLYPLVALTYVWVSLLSLKFLGEKMNKTKWLGIIFIIAGVALIGVAA